MITYVPGRRRLWSLPWCLSPCLDTPAIQIKGYINKSDMYLSKSFWVIISGVEVLLLMIIVKTMIMLRMGDN